MTRDDRLTKILHVLVANDGQWAPLTFSTLGTGSVSLKDHDAVRSGCSDKCSAVAEAGPPGGRVEGDVAQAVAECAEQEGDMAAEPCELQSADIILSQYWAFAWCLREYLRLGKLHQSGLQRLRLRWLRGSHDGNGEVSRAMSVL